MRFEVRYFNRPFGQDDWQENIWFREEIPEADIDEANALIARMVEDGAEVSDTDKATVYTVYPFSSHMTQFIFYK